MHQISLYCDLEKLWDETIKLTQTHRIILIQACYNEPYPNGYDQQQVIGYVIIAEPLEER